MGETDQRYPVIARVCASGIWESTSPLHIGGDGDFESNTDMALARDFAGRPYIPAGAQHQGHAAEQRRHGRHQDRPEPQGACLINRILRA